MTLLFTFSVHAEVCLEPLAGMPLTEQLSSNVTQIAEKECSKKIDDNYMDMVTGCLSGGKNSALGFIQGFIELVKLLLVEAPAWLWNEASDKIEELSERGSESDRNVHEYCPLKHVFTKWNLGHGQAVLG